MFDVGDTVYIRDDATPKELDYNSDIQPGDGPFTIEEIDRASIDWVKLKEFSWWVHMRGVVGDKPALGNRILRKIAFMEKRWKERYN